MTPKLPERGLGMGLRMKLTIYVVGFVVLVLWVFGYITSAIQRDIYLQEAERQGQSMLAAFSIPCTMAIANGQIENLDNLVELVMEDAKKKDNLDIHYVAVLDHKGTALAHSDQSLYGASLAAGFYLAAIRSDESLMTLRTGDEHGEMMEVSYPVASGLRWGTLVAGISLERMEAQIAHNKLLNIILIVGMAALAALFLYIILSRVIIKRVVGLRDATHALEKGILDTRLLAPRDPSDEVDELQIAFNRMAAQIQSYTEDLEAKVQDRTKALAQAKDQLSIKNRSLEEAIEKLEELATTDGLTGIYNHRSFKRILDFEVQRAVRSGQEQTLLLMDVDDFKHYNDTQGHLAGDGVLKGVADALRASLRPTDIIARYGGEEFVVVLLDTSKRDGMFVAEKIRRTVEETEFHNQDTQPGGTLTISIGVAAFPRDASTTSDIIEKADKAMYKAKRGGKNRVVAA